MAVVTVVCVCVASVEVLQDIERDHARCHVRREDRSSSRGAEAGGLSWSSHVTDRCN